MDRVDESERMLIIVIIMFMAIAFVSVVLLYSNNQNVDELIEYSSDEWAVTQVESKSVKLNGDNSVTYVLHVTVHDKASFESFSVDKELYDQVNENDLVRYSFIDNFIVEKFKE